MLQSVSRQVLQLIFLNWKIWITRENRHEKLDGNLQNPNEALWPWWNERKNEELWEAEDGWMERLDRWWTEETVDRLIRRGKWWINKWRNSDGTVCVCVCWPVGPVCLRSLVLAGGGHRRRMWVWESMGVCVWVCIGGRVGGTRGALGGGVVGVGGWGAAVVQTVELVHLLICRFWEQKDRERQRSKCHTLFLLNVSHITHTFLQYLSLWK